ncbi:substrate-binding domain-containing protein [Streptomyces sp. NPDC019937]|uniref:substrate-binding domain-containing protein n=1 Tax=Streptomyces sp. NPDC019937 TaxID=3154787 RepID=UPI0033F00DAE
MLLDRHRAVDAVLCGSDQMARGALDILRERGHRVPEDVAVMGFDNRQVLTSASRPPLTSVDMSLEQVGAGARACSARSPGHRARGSGPWSAAW